MDFECPSCKEKMQLEVVFDATTNNLEQSHFEDEHYKEVFARFGKAIYYAQVLEHQIVNTLLGVVMASGDIRSEDDINSFLDKNFAHTMGTLIRLLSEKKLISEGKLLQLKSAKKERDELVHNYFKQNISSAYSYEGRNKMIEKFEQAVSLFNEVDEYLTDVARQLFNNLGIDDEKIQDHYEELVDKWRSTSV